MSNKIYCGLTVMELYAKCIRVYYINDSVKFTEVVET